MSSIARKLRRSWYDNVRKAGASLVARVERRAAVDGNLEEGPLQYERKSVGTINLYAARIALSRAFEDELWMFAGCWFGVSTEHAALDGAALDIAAMSAARKSVERAGCAPDELLGPVQGPHTMRDDAKALTAYAWRVGSSASVVEPHELRHLTRLLWRKVSFT